MQRATPELMAGTRPGQLTSNAVFGMIIFVVAEVMFFGALVSAFTIAEAATPGGWPPPFQPRLPVGETALNTLALLASGVLVFIAGRAHRAGRDAGRLLLAGVALGSFFVVFQGMEWAALIAEGLTIRSSTHGSFFYLIVGTHALHAVAALLALGWGYASMRQRQLPPGRFTAIRIFWYFVVVVWPILYGVVYL